MSEEKFVLETFVPEEATDEEFAELAALENASLAETDPDDPPITVEFLQKRLASISTDYLRRYIWVARETENGQMVGVCNDFYPLKDNLHVTYTITFVHPDWRRMGIGKAFLRRIVETADKENRRLLGVIVNDAVESGTAFVKAVGFEVGRTDEWNQVKIADVDRDLMRSWVEMGKEKAAGFEIGFWDALPPEEDLEGMAKVIDVGVNDAPSEDLDIEDIEYTPERVRETYENMIKQGRVILTKYVRETQTGELAGATVVSWHPEQAHELSQHGTMVKPKFRGKGMGRWVKAAMFEKVVERLPEVKVIRTANTASNAPMLKINHEMGFTMYKREVLYQISINQVKEFFG